MSASTRKINVSVTDSTMGSVTINVKKTNGNFDSGYVQIAGREGKPAQFISFSRNEDLLEFLQCVKEFEQELNKGKGN